MNKTFDLWRGLQTDAAIRRIANFYGSTEVTDVIYQIFEEPILDQLMDQVPIGLPIWNTAVYIVDDRGDIVPEGEVGELYVASANVADGYVHLKSAANSSKIVDEQKTLSAIAECPFSRNPFDTTPILVNMYRMGDLGVMSNGRVALKGRADGQVKLNGGH